jgi:flavin-dependent dehydrogenase
MVGTVRGRGGVLLVGDAAGLVNPLHGEGTSQALRSGRAAAEAVLSGRDGAAGRDRRLLSSTLAPDLAVSAPAEMQRFEALVPWIAHDGLDERVNVDRPR